MFPVMMAALALMQSPVCAAPEGAAQLWADPATRFVFIGENHGTSQAPAAFAELVCEAALTRQVQIALEMPIGMQPAIDAWMASDGGAEARAAFLADGFWTPTMLDGRSSVAMLEMLERLHAMKAAGRPVEVRAFQPSDPTPPGFDQAYYEIDMAQRLVRIAQERPEALVLILGGNLHATKIPRERDDLMFAAAHLPPKTIVSLTVANQGGLAWNCQAARSGGTPPEIVCGPHASGVVDDPSERGVILGPINDGAWDGRLSLGPTTASPPATAGTD